MTAFAAAASASALPRMSASGTRPSRREDSERLAEHEDIFQLENKYGPGRVQATVRKEPSPGFKAQRPGWYPHGLPVPRNL